MAASPRADFEQAGELKFGQVGIANLRVRELDIERLRAEMIERVQRAPKMFEHAAVVVDFGSLSRCPDLASARQLLAALTDAGVHPVALAFGTTEIEHLARQLKLPLLAKFRAQYETADRAAVEASAPAPAPAPPAPVAPVPQPAAEPTVGMLHTQTVRSGQQLYAKARDLTLCGSVGAGAEVIADGSIHVYGALRGRALAGAQGNPAARIFCREFHAELVAIAGQYRVMEDLPPELYGRAVQVWLEDGKLRLAELG